MYKGYNLKIDLKLFEDYLSDGKKLFSTNKNIVKSVLDDFYTESGMLQASKMQDNWFPQIDADVFISHSHADEEGAIAFSGYLKEELGLNSFVDSCLWGHANELLKKIDDNHCKNTTDNNYNYDKRNRSTAHVHMMLTTSLSMMMDNTESVFFLNTPASLDSQNFIKNGKTTSPWIYTEIAMTKILRKNKPQRMVKLAKAMNERNAYVEYEIELDHLTTLDMDDLQKWHESKSRSKHNLDVLYSLNPYNS